MTEMTEGRLRMIEHRLTLECVQPHDVPALIAALRDARQELDSVRRKAARYGIERDEAFAALAAAQAERDAAQQEAAGWRCFQCGMLLTTEHEARGHFGNEACVSIRHERERLRLATALAEARLVLRKVEPDVQFACDRYAENAYSTHEKQASMAACDRLERIAAVLAQEEKP